MPTRPAGPGSVPLDQSRQSAMLEAPPAEDKPKGCRPASTWPCPSYPHVEGLSLERRAGTLRRPATVRRVDGGSAMFAPLPAGEGWLVAAYAIEDLTGLSSGTRSGPAGRRRHRLPPAGPSEMIMAPPADEFREPPDSTVSGDHQRFQDSSSSRWRGPGRVDRALFRQTRTVASAPFLVCGVVVLRHRPAFPVLLHGRFTCWSGLPDRIGSRCVPDRGGVVRPRSAARPDVNALVPNSGRHRRQVGLKGLRRTSNGNEATDPGADARNQEPRTEKLET